MPTPAEDVSSFNYYPNTMITLASIAYDDMGSIPAQVAAQTDLTVVWGPAQLTHWDGIAYSAAYIAHRSDPDEYTVVIRGTDPESLSSWTGEDFDVSPTQPFDQFAANAPSDAAISQGTYNGLNDLLQLTDPNTGKGILAYLQEVNPGYLYVTGHSLGGTLTPPMFAYLNYQLYGGGFVHNMAPFSFAGLTPGNAAFNSYYNGLFNPEFTWRFYNTLDFAPLCWWSLTDVQNIYTPWNLGYGFPESDLLDPVFKKAEGIGYAQPLGGYALSGVFDTGILYQTWATQAIHQHHHTTYQTLVATAFPT